MKIWAESRQKLELYVFTCISFSILGLLAVLCHLSVICFCNYYDTFPSTSTCVWLYAFCTWRNRCEMALFVMCWQTAAAGLWFFSGRTEWLLIWIDRGLLWWLDTRFVGLTHTCTFFSPSVLCAEQILTAIGNDDERPGALLAGMDVYVLTARCIYSRTANLWASLWNLDRQLNLCENVCLSHSY